MPNADSKLALLNEALSVRKAYPQECPVLCKSRNRNKLLFETKSGSIEMLDLSASELLMCDAVAPAYHAMPTVCEIDDLCYYLGVEPLSTQVDTSEFCIDVFMLRLFVKSRLVPGMRYDDICETQVFNTTLDKLAFMWHRFNDIFVLREYQQ